MWSAIWRRLFPGRRVRYQDAADLEAEFGFRFSVAGDRLTVQFRTGDTERWRRVGAERPAGVEAIDYGGVWYVLEEDQ